MYWEADKELRVLLSPLPLRILSLCQQQKLLAPGWHASSFCPLCSSHLPPSSPTLQATSPMSRPPASLPACTNRPVTGRLCTDGCWGQRLF